MLVSWHFYSVFMVEVLQVLSVSFATVGICALLRFWRYSRRNRLPVNRETARQIMQKALEMNRFHSFSAQQLADMIRSGSATSTEITKAHIDHIKLVNPLLNAVVRDRFDEALQEAAAADDLITNYKAEGISLDTLPPLHGVPCTVKECFALTGMPNASGLVSRKDVIASEDATVVKRIRGMCTVKYTPNYRLTETSNLFRGWSYSHGCYQHLRALYVDGKVGLSLKEFTEHT